MPVFCFLLDLLNGKVLQDTLCMSVRLYVCLSVIAALQEGTGPLAKKIDRALFFWEISRIRDFNDAVHIWTPEESENSVQNWMSQIRDTVV